MFMLSINVINIICAIENTSTSNNRPVLICICRRCQMAVALTFDKRNEFQGVMVNIVRANMFLGSCAIWDLRDRHQKSSAFANYSMLLEDKNFNWTRNNYCTDQIFDEGDFFFILQ